LIPGVVDVVDELHVRVRRTTTAEIPGAALQRSCSAQTLSGSDRLHRVSQRSRFPARSADLVRCRVSKSRRASTEGSVARRRNSGIRSAAVRNGRATGETYCIAHHLFTERGKRKLMVAFLLVSTTHSSSGTAPAGCSEREL
jgi:hypothetical protein